MYYNKAVIRRLSFLFPAPLSFHGTKNLLETSSFVHVKLSNSLVSRRKFCSISTPIYTNSYPLYNNANKHHYIPSRRYRTTSNGTIEDTETTESPDNTPITPRKIMDILDKSIIGQERAKKILSVAVYNHYNRIKINKLNKERNILAKAYYDNHVFTDASKHDNYAMKANQDLKLTKQSNKPYLYAEVEAEPVTEPVPEPSTYRKDPIYSHIFKTDKLGSSTPRAKGVEEFPLVDKRKTLLAKTIASILNVPFSMSDATPLTQAGYVGEDVELVIHRLLQKCNYDVSLAETGIVFIDEIDKISRKIDSNSSSKDVSGEGVQQGLLRMLEGTVITINDKSAGVGAGLGGIGSNIGGPGSDGILNISPGLVDNGNFFMGQPLKSSHLNSRHIPGIEKSDPSFDFLNSKGVADGKTRQNNSKLNDQDLKRFDSLAEEDDSSVKKTSIPLNIPSSSKNGGGTNDFNNLFNAGNISRNRTLSSVGKNSSAFNKPGVFSVDTSNILFILSGAFIGLENYVIDRVAKGSIGFNNPIRNKTQNSAAINLKSDKFDEVDPYSNIKQFFNPIQVGQNFKSESNSPSSKFNPLDYVEPEGSVFF
ncbi:ATP-dependent Clp protease ATP-binding subunit ClpX [Smittium culicis]|uniref:ATP-dependent Clp protease ATP-binding subunit ClpX n=1 Tax=Smittium culicis TaxID=133412 RepID=A0A1R1YKY8_9FUNG|nr:ATP-dependent Clp protease ATP-binding subunit ClpX [Smittium culicis]